MWIQVDFPIKPEVSRALFGDQPDRRRAFRAWLASARTRYQLAVSPVLFGYQEDGSLLQQVRHIGISDYKGGLRLYAVGRENVELVRSAVPLIHSALIRDSGCLVMIAAREGQCEASFSPFSWSYYAASLQASKSNGDDDLVRAWDVAKAANGSPMTDREVLKLTGAVIDRSLSRQWRMLVSRGELASDEVSTSGVVFGSEGLSRDHYAGTFAEVQQALGIADRKSSAIFDVKVNSIGDARWVCASSSGHGRRLVLKHVEFTARVALKGLWLAGKALSLGDGVVLPATRVWATDREAA